LFFAFVLLVPLGAAWVCSRLGAAFSGISESWRRIAGGFGVLLAPLGFSMWAAHFLFHFLHGLFAPWPVFQRAASDVGLSPAPPDWSAAPGLMADTTGLGILLLNAGCLYSLWLLWKKSCTAAPVRPAGIFMPWAVLVLLVYAFGVWLVFQPMEMRGLL
jgi:uncharacterized protein (TIGR03382 family)